MQFKKGKVIVLTWLIYALLSAFAYGYVVKNNPPSADEAFVFSYTVQPPNKILAHWKIASGTYLYKDRIHFDVTPQTKLDIKYPLGKKKLDFDKKPYEVYTGEVTIPVQFEANTQTLQFNVSYQGCSEKGFCYPPMKQLVTLTIAAPVAKEPPTAKADVSEASLSTLMTDQNGVNALLHSHQIGWMMLLFVGLGLLLAFTPCVLPMFPILTSIVVGQSQPVNPKKAFMLSVIYVLGSAMTYAAAGVLAASMGSALQIWLEKPWILAMTSALFVLLALSLFGLYELRLPNRVQNHLMSLSNQQQGGTYIGVFLMGVLSTLIVSPCVTAPLVGVLMFISQTGDRLLGASALFAMGLGMGVPLVIIGTSAGKWLPKSGPWMEAVKKGFGILMLGMAVWLFARVVSPTVTLVFWGILLLIIATFFVTTIANFVKLRKIARFFGALFAISGMLIIVGGMGGMPSPLMKFMTSYQTADDQRFVVIHDVADFNKQLALAQAAHQPVILDFYADWCASCVSMDRSVFATADIQQKLTPYVLLRADLSANSEADQDLLKYFNVVAPPTVLFFNADGKEINSQRIVGEVDAKEFMVRLNRL